MEGSCKDTITATTKEIMIKGPVPGYVNVAFKRTSFVESKL